MGLFVDGPACTIADLTDQDAGLLDTAVSAGINVSTKLRLALEEISTDLTMCLERQFPRQEFHWRPALRVEQIVVTPPLKQWEAMHAMALFYRDAYFSQFVDRYQAKWQEFSRLACDVREGCLAEGVGFVKDPVKQAAPPTLSTTPGPQSGGMFYASIAWVNATSQQGAASFPSSITVSDGNLMTVSASGAPASAAGFNVYAGSSLDAMFRQNDVVLPPSGTYLYVPGQVSQGRLPGSGQAPDFMRPLARTMLRG
jgi:hypothetical protein